MALKPFEELRKVDISKHIQKRDGLDYLPWADCVALLHEHGAKDVYWLPIPAADGSSLHRSEKQFTGKSGLSNCVYETQIEIHIDDMVWVMTSPVMNGSNPVQDNSMTQLRVWTSMCRSFVKGVAIRTGLGFDLWMKGEAKETEDTEGLDDISKHSINKVQERVQEKLTALNKAGLTVPDIAEDLGMTEDQLRSIFAQYAALWRFEKDLDQLSLRKLK